MSLTEKFVSILKKNNWNFYHFTDVRNLPTIKAQGLLSTAEINRKKLIVVTSGNQWSLDADVSKGMNKFVHLCFFSSHPMEFRAKQQNRIGTSKFLSISPDVLLRDGAQISKDVSNRASAKFGPAEDMFGEIDLDIIYKWNDWKDPAVKARLQVAKKYEILIPDSIPAEYIRNI